jgi:5-(carboxyamino)imidazole ribonucleotide synthase
VIRSIGILGGGQLGRMLTLEAKRMGYRVVTLEPFPNAPAGQVADEQLVAAYDDLRAIGELGARTDIVTYEFENIPLSSVRALEEAGRFVRPSANVLRITQDRTLEKAFVRSAKCETAQFAEVRTLAELQHALRMVSPVFSKPHWAATTARGNGLYADKSTPKKPSLLPPGERSSTSV